MSNGHHGRRLDRLEARMHPGDGARFAWSRLDPAEQERLSELGARCDEILANGGRDFTHLSPREAYELDGLIACGMGEKAEREIGTT